MAGLTSMRWLAAISAIATVLAACGAASPVTSGVWMSGAWEGESPARQFAIDGKARLPAGDWDITAVAVFGRDRCGSDELHTTIRIHVIDPAGG